MRALPRAGAAVVLLQACAGAPIQTYPGPPRPAAEVALLRAGPDGAIAEIDGAKTSGSAWALLPGSHEIRVNYRIYTTAPNMSWTIWTYCWVVLPAEAGQSYQTVVRVSKQVVSPSVSDNVKMEIGIADASGLLVGLPAACVAKRPRPGTPRPARPPPPR
jgi:hypothetical protein